MRCVSCDKELNDREATRKGAFSGEYLDLCDCCLATTDIDFYEREDLADNFVDEEDEFFTP